MLSLKDAEYGIKGREAEKTGSGRVSLGGWEEEEFMTTATQDGMEEDTDAYWRELMVEENFKKET